MLKMFKIEGFDASGRCVQKLAIVTVSESLILQPTSARFSGNETEQ